MKYTKLYRVTYILKLALEDRSISAKDWQYFGLDADLDRKMIHRDVHAVRELLAEVYDLQLAYSNVRRRYEVYDL